MDNLKLFDEYDAWRAVRANNADAKSSNEIDILKKEIENEISFLEKIKFDLKHYSQIQLVNYRISDLRNLLR